MPIDIHPGLAYNERKTEVAAMSRKTVIVNIYNFIRMSHVEPSHFIPDDFDTIRNQILCVKQYGFPGTYALKYDALMEPRYQALLKEYLDECDEISAWWEITEPLCRRAGVRFRGWNDSEEYDDRVDSAYSIGYSPEERKALVDAYMADFHEVFGKYPESIGSWVLDSVTMGYAREKYGLTAAAICRDQMGVDGFTLWGGYPNGMYFPSRKNEHIPAQREENQLDLPVFRLLGPDPIYNFEADVRDGLQGVYTLEPSWLIGRDPKWISWFFDRLTDEDALGVGYAHVGQENNFLWENIKPGFSPQLDVVKKLHSQGKIRVETMADSARWFRKKYKITPPLTFQASKDWDKERNLSAQWYACANYRVGFLGEKGHLRIRDCFCYDEAYQSRYLHKPMSGTRSLFDALPVLFPQVWKTGERPYIWLRDSLGNEPVGKITYRTLDELNAAAELESGGGKTCFRMSPEGIRVEGECALIFDTLPVYVCHSGRKIEMCHEGFAYRLEVAQGEICRAGTDGVEILPENGGIFLKFGENAPVFTEGYLQNPRELDQVCTPAPVPKLAIPPFSPEFDPGDRVFSVGQTAEITVRCRDAGEIRYTLDGTEPGEDSALYVGPIPLDRDAVVKAKTFLPDGRVSETARAEYRFCLTELALESSTELDWRPVFHGKGLEDLLGGKRGTLDYLDGTWRGTLQDIDVTCTLEEPREVKSIAMGFLSHHRSGIVYPESVALYVGADKDSLALASVLEMPRGPGEREIEKMDAVFALGQPIGAFRIVARRYERMPQWCAYRGTATVFTMADSLMVTL